MGEESFPAMLRRLRQARGWSQARLAEALCQLSGRPTVSRQDVYRWEKGKRTPQYWLSFLAKVLEVDRETMELALAEQETEAEQDMRRRALLLVGSGALAGGPPSTNNAAELEPLAVRLRDHLLTRPLNISGLELGSVEKVEDGVRRAHGMYQGAQYTSAAELLPALIHNSERLAVERRATRHSHRVVALAYLAASKLAAKLGDGELAWITADRAGVSAMQAEDVLLHALANGQAANALLKIPNRVGEAERIVGTAYDQFMRFSAGSDPALLSSRGSLLLIAATIASRLGQNAAVRMGLNAASDVAEELGHDGNHLWTGFGPTNVALHRVAVAVALHQPEVAIATAIRLDTSRLPAALVSRRAQVHLDLAAAFGSSRNDAPAVLHLLEAERIAPQVVRMNHRTRALIGQLARRERHGQTPGLRALTLRAGVTV